MGELVGRFLSFEDHLGRGLVKFVYYVLLFLLVVTTLFELFEALVAMFSGAFWPGLWAFLVTVPLAFLVRLLLLRVGAELVIAVLSIDDNLKMGGDEAAMPSGLNPVTPPSGLNPVTPPRAAPTTAAPATQPTEELAEKPTGDEEAEEPAKARKPAPRKRSARKTGRKVPANKVPVKKTAPKNQPSTAEGPSNDNPGAAESSDEPERPPTTDG